MNARNAMSRAASAITIRRLLKNFNIAPCPDRFEPDIHLVVHLFLNHVVADCVRYLRQRRNRIQTPFLRFRYENLIVVFFQIDVRRADELPEPEIEKLLNADPAADGAPNRRGKWPVQDALVH